jgi:hypothetical protein
MIQSIEKIPDVCRDPDDNHILACAVEGNADYVVTVDGDFLILKEIKNIRIMKLRDVDLLFND